MGARGQKRPGPRPHLPGGGGEEAKIPANKNRTIGAGGNGPQNSGADGQAPSHGLHSPRTPAAAGGDGDRGRRGDQPAVRARRRDRRDLAARRVLRTRDRYGRVGRSRSDRRGDLARRQPAGGLQVPRETVEEATEEAVEAPMEAVADRMSKQPARTTAPFMNGAWRVFDLSIG